MRLDVPIWFDYNQVCDGISCITQTQTYFINILEPSTLFQIGICSMWTLVIIGMYKFHSKCNKQKVKGVE